MDRESLLLAESQAIQVRELMEDCTKDCLIGNFMRNYINIYEYCLILIEENDGLKKEIITLKREIANLKQGEDNGN